MLSYYLFDTVIFLALHRIKWIKGAFTFMHGQTPPQFSLAQEPLSMQHTLTQLRKVGQTALELPAFGFGAAHIGELYNTVSEADSQATLNGAWDRGISVIIGAPFASGILVTGSRSSAKYGYSDASVEVQKKVRAIEEVCALHKVALPTAALQFPLAHPAVVSIIPGAARPHEVVENINSFQATIRAAFWEELKERGLIDRHSPVPGGA